MEISSDPACMVRGKSRSKLGRLIKNKNASVPSFSWKGPEIFLESTYNGTQKSRVRRNKSKQKVKDMYTEQGQITFRVSLVQSKTKSEYNQKKV